MKRKVKIRGKYRCVTARELIGRLLHRCDRCHYCGIRLVLGTATVDHKIPRARGGHQNLNNMTLACRRCNVAKGDLMPWEFSVVALEQTG